MLAALFLALQDSLAADTAAQTTPLIIPPAESLNALDLLVKGGLVMIPILFLSILTVYLFVERLLSLRKAQSNPEKLTQAVGDYVRSGDLTGAVGYCRAQDSPASRIIQRGLERVGRPIAEIKEAVQTAGKHEAFMLEKRMDMIASAAAIAPMLGFLGTVTGLIQAFQQIQRLQGAVNPSMLAAGIWEALVTTAFGLGVGIMALFAYNLLINRINRTINDLERASTDFIDLLQTPTS
ncbi:MAG: MotA/TolQ/ExbB proton channel family protein [Bacteroidetes bacterium]|nr:MotA/TolQ/ExbB proton channel family protein [Bacteroidota bacterium]